MTKETLQQLAREEFEKQFSYMRPSAIQKARHEVGVLNPNDFEDIECLLDVLIARAFEAAKMHLWSAEGMQIALKEKMEEVRAATLVEVKERIEGWQQNYPLDIFSPPWEGWQKDVDELAKLHGKRIDNISADYGRRHQKLFTGQVLEAINQLTPEKNTHETTEDSLFRGAQEQLKNTQFKHDLAGIPFSKPPEPISDWEKEFDDEYKTLFDQFGMFGVQQSLKDFIKTKISLAYRRGVEDLGKQAMEILVSEKEELLLYYHPDANGTRIEKSFNEAFRLIQERKDNFLK